MPSSTIASSIVLMKSDGFLSCFGGSSYQIYAILSDSAVEDLPPNCFHMFTTLMIPYDFSIYSYNYHNKLRLSWFKPTCGHCEAKGKRCRLKSRDTKLETECFLPKPSKGDCFYSHLIILCSLRFCSLLLTKIILVIISLLL